MTFRLASLWSLSHSDKAIKQLRWLQVASMFLGSLYDWDWKFFSFTLLFNISWMPLLLFTYGLHRKYIVSAINKSIMPTASIHSSLHRLMSLQADVRGQESETISENASKDLRRGCVQSQGSVDRQSHVHPVGSDWNSLSIRPKSAPNLPEIEADQPDQPLHELPFSQSMSQIAIPDPINALKYFHLCLSSVSPL